MPGLRSAGLERATVFRPFFLKCVSTSGLHPTMPPGMPPPRHPSTFGLSRNERARTGGGMTQTPGVRDGTQFLHVPIGISPQNYAPGAGRYDPPNRVASYGCHSPSASLGRSGRAPLEGSGPTGRNSGLWAHQAVSTEHEPDVCQQTTPIIAQPRASLIDGVSLVCSLVCRIHPSVHPSMVTSCLTTVPEL